jgi:hypothetical protein
VKEFTVALAIMGLLTLVLAVVFGSPACKAITIGDWATNAPADFVATAVAELDATGGTATYGAPYVSDPNAGQKIGPLPLPLQRWGGCGNPSTPRRTSCSTRWRPTPTRRSPRP